MVLKWHFLQLHNSNVQLGNQKIVNSKGLQTDALVGTCNHISHALAFAWQAIIAIMAEATNITWHVPVSIHNAGVLVVAMSHSRYMQYSIMVS
jgi:hypothetical protein